MNDKNKQKRSISQSDKQGRCPMCLSNVSIDQFVNEDEIKKFLKTGLCPKCINK